MIAALFQTILQFKAILFGVLAGIISILFIRRDQKNEIKNQELQNRINDARKTKQDQNSFNNLDDAEQSKWMLDDLEKKRNQANK